MRDNFLWGGFNDFLKEIFLTMAICLSLNTSDFQMISIAATINNVFAMLVGIVLLCAPFMIVYKIYKGWSTQIETKPKDRPVYFRP